MLPNRRGFTLFQLLVVLSILALLFALFLPAIGKMRAQAARQQSQNNLKQLALAALNYESTYTTFPPGVDAKGFSASARLLPFLEQEPLYKLINFDKPCDDPANKSVALTIVKVFLNPQDPVQRIDRNFGETNYLFCAGSKYDLKDNNGVFYRDSKVKITQISDGTSNTLMIGETLKGDSGLKATDVHRQHVRLKKADLKDLTDESGVKDFMDDKNIASDRGKAWIDGRFLQGTFTGTRVINDEKPDVDCGGAGGLSALRGLTDGANVAMCDGSVRYVTNKISLATWKLLADKADGQVIPNF